MSVATDEYKRCFASRRIPDRQVSSLWSLRDGYRATDFLAFLLQFKVRLKKKKKKKKKKKSECRSTQIYVAATFCKRCATQKRNSLKKSNEMQEYADIYLLLNYSTCFGRPSRPSSGVHKTVLAASGTDHTIWGLLPRWYDLYQRLQVQFLCTPDEWRDGRPKHVE